MHIRLLSRFPRPCPLLGQVMTTSRTGAAKESAPTTLTELSAWVDEVAALTQPRAVHWCDGSQAENQRLLDKMLADGTL